MTDERYQLLMLVLHQWWTGHRGRWYRAYYPRSRPSFAVLSCRTCGRGF